eukprot:CAMPEP_0202971664 /NCGR_PEP_ID=MMETSP1396-20130829/29339_1 /ASSEMBLY_ACC=CAM_ASM_000872 /TAXON_ID= /ORGANISM="Pseudokeronopsis sp., Strain Brazil" /LENGTH=135 /DNA_ID=CAMNT_0049701271 /DNA_START=39 /DNA_END=446 /DNA_ORIENTATION=-
MSLLFIVLLAVVASVSGQAVGGWFPVDTALSQVQEAAVFAVTHKYPNENPSFAVVSAMKQVVAGLKFDITAEITIAGTCHMDHYQVWNHFGTLSAVVSDTLSTPCGTTVNGNGAIGESVTPHGDAKKVHLRKSTH